MNESDNNEPWSQTRWQASRAESSPPPTPSDLPIYGQPATAPPPVPPAPPAAAPPVPPVSVAPSPAAPAAPPMPSFDNSVLSGSYGSNAPVAPPVDAPGRGGRLAWVAAIMGALVLLVGGGFFALTALGDSGGAETPEAAVDEMLAALGNEDFITMGELLEPGERRTIVEPMVTDILPELIRIGVFDETADAGDFSGVDLEFTDVTYRVDSIGGAPDLAHVWFTGGTVTSSSTGAELPLGEAFREAIGDVPDEPATTEEISAADTPLVVVERNGRWYVSMWYTVAEAARIESGELFPIAPGPSPNGSDSPEQAVEAMLLELVDFDLEGVITTMDPEEASALYRYSPLFLDEAQQALDEAEQSLRDSGARWELTGMNFDVDQDGDDAVVTLRSFEFIVETPDVDVDITYSPRRIGIDVDGVIEGERFRVTVSIEPDRWSADGRAGDDTFSGVVEIDAPARTARLNAEFAGDSVSGSLIIDEDAVCSDYQLRGPDVNEMGCLEDLLREEAVADEDVELVLSQIAGAFDSLPDEFAGLPLVAHETDGSWYVSPTLSAMHGITAGLRSVDDDDFDRLLDQIETQSLVTGPFTDFGNAFDEIDSALDGGDSIVIGEDSFTFPDDDGGVFDDPATDVATFTITPTIDTITTYTDTLPSGNSEHVYLLELDAGQTVGIEVIGSVLDGGVEDTVLTIRTPQGEFYDTNDDYRGLDSGLIFVPPTSGAWQLVVTDLTSFGGEYELVVEATVDGFPTTGADPGNGGGFDDPVDTPTEAEVEDFEFRTYEGAPIVESGEIAAGFYDVWWLDGLEPGAEYTVTVEAGDEQLDPNVFVRDPDTFDLLAENDDAPFGSGLGSLDSLAIFAANERGEVVIEVHSYFDLGSGSYTVTVVSGS